MLTRLLRDIVAIMLAFAVIILLLLVALFLGASTIAALGTIIICPIVLALISHVFASLGFVLDVDFDLLGD